MQAAQSFSGLTMTVSASIATWISTIPSMPLALQASTSESLIGRDASETWVSPRQNFSKPPPVPENATFTRTSETFENSSATASEIGNTVDEPSTWTSPESEP